MRLLPTLPTVLLLMLAGCATQGSQPTDAAASATAARQCFTPSQVTGYSPVDSDSVDINLGTRTVYRLELLGPCPDVDWSQRVGIRSTGGGRWICSGIDAELIVPGPIGRDRCPVSSIRRLSDEEVAARRGR